MRKEVIETGKTVEEAINSACEKLGCEREDCQWEILDLPKRGFLGLKNTPAKVKVSFGQDDAPPAPAAQPQRAPAPQRQPEKKPAPEKRQQQQKPPPQVPAQPVAAQPAPAPAPKKPAAPIVPTAEFEQKAQLAAQYLGSILLAIDLPQAKIVQVWEESGVCLRIEGDGLGLVIGRRGDTLDSLQYLCGLVANRLEGEYLRVTVDCGDYRVRRRATLEALAKRLSAQVLSTETNKALEPMNPFERRIIHATVSEIEGVSSTSIGEEPNRRVVITSPGAKNRRPSFSRDNRERGERGERSERGRSAPRPQIADRPDWPDKGAKGDRPDETATGREHRRPQGRTGRDRDRDGRRGGGRGDRDRRDRPPAYQPSKAEPDIPPSEAENKPLYGKIDLE